MDHHQVARASSLPVPRLEASGLATIIHRATVAFCRHFLDPRSPTASQMIEAARRGVEFVAARGGAASDPSQVELSLGEPATVGFDKLLLDYENFLRHRQLRQWTSDDPEAEAVRALTKLSNQTGPANSSDSSLYAPWLTSTDSAAVANAIICLIQQVDCLLDRQTRDQAPASNERGGSSDFPASQLAPKSNAWASEALIPSGPIPGAPSCPRCGKPMSLRTAKSGARRGSQFWGCSIYPACKGTRPI